MFDEVFACVHSVCVDMYVHDSLFFETNSGPANTRSNPCMISLILIYSTFYLIIILQFPSPDMHSLHNKLMQTLLFTSALARQTQESVSPHIIIYITRRNEKTRRKNPEKQGKLRKLRVDKVFKHFLSFGPRERDYRVR